MSYLDQFSVTFGKAVSVTRSTQPETHGDIVLNFRDGNSSSDSGGSIRTRHETLEQAVIVFEDGDEYPVWQGVTRHFGGVGPDVAKGLTLRHDHGSNYMADDFRNEIECFGIFSSPAFARQPEGNGVAARPTRTLKEQLLWVRRFATAEEHRQALAAFAAEHNASWLRQRHGYKTFDQIRAEQKALSPEAATGVLFAGSAFYPGPQARRRRIGRCVHSVALRCR